MSDLESIFVELRSRGPELLQALDLRLRTEHDLPLAMLETMTAIDAAGRCDIPRIARSTATDPSSASVMVARIEARGLCIRDPYFTSAPVRGLTLPGNYLLLHASRFVAREVCVTLDGRAPAPSTRTVAAALARLRCPAPAAPSDALSMRRARLTLAVPV